MEVRTLQKSVRRATLNGNGAKNLQKSLLVPSLDALFRPRARFWSIFGSRPGPKMASKPAPAKKWTGILVAENQFFAFSSLGRVPEGSRTDSGGSGDPPAPDFEMILFCDTFLLLPSGSCRGLSGSAGMLPGSAPNLCNPLAGVPLGYGDSRSGLNKVSIRWQWSSPVFYTQG